MIEQPRVLVVDDDAPMVELLVTVLRDAGLEVEAALGGSEAIAMFEASPQALREFDLVLTDQRMPEISGTELAAWLGLRQGPPVLLMSGGTVPEEEGLAIEILVKPFPLDTLLQRVRTLTGAARQKR